MNRLAISISSCMRPDCLRQCFESLERNKNLKKVDFYLNQDGAVNLSSGIQHVTDEKIEECIQVFEESKLPNKFVKRQSHNIGAGLMRFYEFKELFDKGYEYVIHLDDDLIVSKYYIQTMLRLFKQFQNQPDIGMIQTLSRGYRDISLGTIQHAKKCKNQVQYGFGKRWEQGFWKHSWKVIEPRLQELIQLLKECDFKLLIDNDPNLLSLQEKLLDTYGGFHVDVAIENCLIIEGFQGLTTRTNRHRVIENVGYYSFQGNGWKRAGLDKVTLFDIPSPKKFQIVNNKLCIAIRTLKRPDYLWRMVRELRRNIDIKDTDFYFYIDGAVNPYSGIRYAKDSEPLRCLHEIQKIQLPNKIMVMKKENVQTAIQKYEMLSTLFPRYDYVMMLDNDLVVDKYYVSTIKTLFEQFKDDPKAGILHTFYTPPRQRFIQDLTLEKAKKLADKVQYGFGRRWEQGFWKESWEKIKPYYEIYMRYAGKCDYKQLISDNPVMDDEREKILKYFPELNADAALEFAAYRIGYLGLHTEVPRHIGIGIKGMYTYRTEEFWKDRGLDKAKLFNIKDVDRFSFRAEMKYAEDCRDLFKDKTVYIVGSGPSLDTYPDDFLWDKVGITLHLAYLKYPNATFRGICESPIMRWFQKNRSEFFEKKGIFTNPFHPGDAPQHFLGNGLEASPNSIFVRYIPDESYLFGTTFRKLIRKAINGEPVIAGAKTTVLHSILFAVLTIGAKDIRLIGCDHSKKEGESYYSLAQKVEAGELRVRYRSSIWYDPWMCNRQQSGTNDFIDECGKHNIQIIRYKDYNHWSETNYFEESYFEENDSEANYFGENPPKRSKIKYRPGAKG